MIRLPLLLLTYFFYNRLVMNDDGKKFCVIMPQFCKRWFSITIELLFIIFGCIRYNEEWYASNDE